MDVRADKSAICLVMPIFNDWAALPRLLGNLADAFRGSGSTLDIVLVNDASTESEHFQIENSATHDVISEITIVDLGVNVGHQMAITAGLHYAQQHKAFTAVLIMDADGEDEPQGQAHPAYSANNRTRCARKKRIVRQLSRQAR